MDLNNLSDEFKYGVIKDTKKGFMFLTPLARLSFVKVAEPEEYKGKRKYTTTVMFESDENNEGCVDLRKLFIPKLMALAKTAKCPVKSTPDGLVWGDNNIVMVRKGIKFTTEGEPYMGMSESTVSFKASTPEKSPPLLFSPLGDKDYPADKFYGGCYGRCWVDVYVSEQHNMISFGLRTVQKLADGEPLESGSSGFEMGAAPGAEAEKTDMDKAADAAAETGDFSNFL